MKIDAIKVPLELTVPEDVAEACCKILEVYLSNHMELVIEQKDIDRGDWIDRRILLVKRNE